MTDLRSKTIRLAYARPELRAHLLPILKEAADPEESPKARYKKEYKVRGMELSEMDFRRYLAAKGLNRTIVNPYARDHGLEVGDVFMLKGSKGAEYMIETGKRPPL